MAATSHLSIGEVLVLLQDEFPDVTVSKIRFLESQGLLDPARSPSGYRKFSEGDIAKLQWILRQQREHFLPLKVIKERLEASSGEVPDDVASTSPSTTEATDEDAGRLFGLGTGPAENDESVADEHVVDEPVAAADEHVEDVEEEQVNKRTNTAGRGRKRVSRRRDEAQDADKQDLATSEAATEKPRPASRPRSAPVATDDEPQAGAAGGGGGVEPPVLDGGPSDLLLTGDELAAASGLAPRQLLELVSYGLLPASATDEAAFDGDDLVVARVASRFLAHGLEARHLKRWKAAAEAEAGLYEQVVAPLVREGDGQRTARDTLHELVELGDQLQAALMRRAVRDVTL